MEKNIPKIVVGIFIAIAVSGIINSFYLSSKEKIYTIGKIYSRTNPGRKTTYFFVYIIGKDKFEGSVVDLNRFTTNKNGLLYIELLKDNFEHYHVLEFNKVPDCLTIGDVPVEGWKAIPENPCE